MACELRVFTLNCWGIPVVSKDRKPRMKAIAEFLLNSTYDVVCLQEVWSDADYNLIKDQVITVLPYAHYFYSGVIGSGVCVLSKHPLQEVFFHQWSVNGYIHKLQHGDWFGGKGVGMCKIRVKDFNVNVYSAHLHAEYNRTNDEYQAHRVIQAFDTAQFIQLTSSSADLIVLAGDLNTEPGDLAYKILVGVTEFNDAYVEADEDTRQVCSTNEGLKNSYTPMSLVKKQTAGKRIDYIMYRCRSDIDVALKSYHQPCPDRIPNHNCSYSDHEAISAALSLAHGEQQRAIKNNVKIGSALESALAEAVSICDDALIRLLVHKRIYWFFSFLLLVLLIMTFVTDAPFDFIVLYHVIRILMTALFGFTVIMATLWNSIETNAILAGKLGMSVSLKRATLNVGNDVQVLEM